MTRTRSQRRRLERIQRRMPGDLNDDGIPMVTIEPETWPASVRDRYDAAEDQEIRHRIILAQTGQTVSERPGIVLIEVWSSEHSREAEVVG